MNWTALLQERLNDPNNLLPYRLAVAIEGEPLPPGRQLYAIADVLGVTPGELMTALRKEFAEEEVTAEIDSMERAIVAACDKVD